MRAIIKDISIGLLSFAAFTFNAYAAGNVDDRQADFLRKVHAINLAEIDAGTLAQNNGQNQAVKDYGAMLATDHKAADEKVRGVAKTDHVDLDAKAKSADLTDLEKKLQAMEADLRRTPKGSFDQEFARKMVEGHDNAIEMVQQAKLDFVSNNAIETLASDLLPQLEKHRNQAADLLSRAGGVAH